MVATPLGNVFYADRSVEDLEATTKNHMKGWSPFGLYFLSWNYYSSKHRGKRHVVLCMTCMFKLQIMQRTHHTQLEKTFFTFSHCQRCSDSFFLLEYQIVSQKLETRNWECKLSDRRTLGNKNYISGLKLWGNWMKCPLLSDKQGKHGECAVAAISCLQTGKEWTKE